MFIEHLRPRLDSGNKEDKAWPLASSLFWGCRLNSAMHSPILEGCLAQILPASPDTYAILCVIPCPDLCSCDGQPSQGILGTKTSVPKLASYLLLPPPALILLTRPCLPSNLLNPLGFRILTRIWKCSRRQLHSLLYPENGLEKELLRIQRIG